MHLRCCITVHNCVEIWTYGLRDRPTIIKLNVAKTNMLNSPVNLICRNAQTICIFWDIFANKLNTLGSIISSKYVLIYQKIRNL